MDYFVAAVLLTIIVGGFVLVSKSDSNESNEQYKSPLQQKQEDYTAALTALRADPTNPAFHEQALHRGRIYASATRENKAVTLFDETALANDIRAVTANATQTTVPVAALNSATAPATSLDDRINALLKMKASGLITDAEFDHKRKELLASI